MELAWPKHRFTVHVRDCRGSRVAVVALPSSVSVKGGAGGWCGWCTVSLVIPYPISDNDPGSGYHGGPRGRAFGSMGEGNPGRLGATGVRGMAAVGCNLLLSGSSMGAGRPG